MFVKIVLGLLILLVALGLVFSSVFLQGVVLGTLVCWFLTEGKIHWDGSSFENRSRELKENGKRFQNWFFAKTWSNR